MMEAADHRRLDDAAFVESLHRSWLRGVLLQGEVGAGPVVVAEVRAQQAAQMGFVQHHHVVEALAAEGADEPFHVGILPRRGAVLTSWISMVWTRLENAPPYTASRSRRR